ncbi:hypothetical protein COCOBI_04-0210 [Coccomyxa sp. Obi]|nr:hypothetical protein COCOBI_04-0210 [Coccomyxa sp. Obi]
MDARRRSGSEPHKSESGEDGRQRNSVAPEEAGGRENAWWCATSAPPQHASTGTAVQGHGVAACQAVLGGGTRGNAALQIDLDSHSEDARQRPYTSARVAFDAHGSSEHECCSDRTQPEAAQAADPEHEAKGLRSALHAEREDAVAAIGVDSAEPRVSRDNVDAELNVVDGEDECRGINQGIVATSFWRKKRQKVGGVLDLWNRANQRT